MSLVGFMQTPVREVRMMSVRRLTQDELEAIHEALAFRLADEIEDTSQPTQVYQRALAKIEERLR